MILYDDTFVTLEFADSYFQKHQNGDIWDGFSDDKKTNALIFATKKVNNFNFVGNKKSSGQKLEFPRDFQPELPVEIQYAVCEEALTILQNSPHTKNAEYGISSVKMGNTEVSYFGTSNLGVLLSKQAVDFVSKWTSKTFRIS